MAKSKKVLQGVNDGQNFNPADYTPYQAINTPTNYYSTGDVNTFDYSRDNSLDRGNLTPYDLPDLNDTRTANQGTLSSLGNSTASFLGKTVNSVIGGVAGTIYGVGSAIANKDVSKLWDNSFLDKTDEIDKGLGDIFKVYKSSDYLQSNFLQRAFLHPLQFTDDATQALSFTAGAIISTLITEGAADAMVVPKALKFMKTLSQGAEAAEATAELLSPAQKLLRGVSNTNKVVRDLAAGASYESIVEARKATMDLRDKMYSDFAKDHPGQDMDENTKKDIDSRLTQAGLFTYLSNLALVGSTNLAQFPKIFGLGYNTSRIAEGSIVRNVESGLFKAAEHNTGLVSKIATALKNPFEEGVKEEGLQDVISNTAQQYWDRKNDTNSKDEVGRFLTTAAHNLADTYTSKEGWNDIGMGMIIGGLGAPGKGALSILGENNAIGKHGYDVIRDPLTGEITGTKRKDIWTGGVLGGFEEQAEERHKIAQVVDDLNNHTDLGKSMQANYDFLVQSNSLEKDKEKALSIGDIFNFQNAKDDQIHSYISSRIKAGMFQDVLDNIDNMKKQSSEEFYTQFKGQEASDNATDIEKTRYQQDTIREFEQKAKNTNEAIKIGDSVYKGDNEDLREELVHSIAASKNLDVRENLINQSLADLSGGYISNLGLRNDTDGTIEKQLVENFENNNPTDATINGDKIIQLLNDSRKLRAKRQQYLDIYNHLFTEKGQKDFEDHQVKAKETIQKLEDLKQQKEEEKITEDIKKQNVKETVQKAKDLETPTDAIANEDIPNVNFDEELTVPKTTETTTGSPEVTTPEVSEETKLTPEEAAVVKIEQHKEVQANREVAMFDDGLTNNPTPEHYTKIGDLPIINTDLQRTIGNTISYLGIDKVVLGRVNEEGEVESRTFDTFDNNGDININPNVETKLFSQDYYNPGTKVKLFIPTIGQMGDRGLDNYSQADYTTNIDNVEEFPIGISGEDGKLIGYLPTQSGINRLVAEQFRQQALADNLALRQTIFNNKEIEYNTTITSKSPGFIITDKFENQKSLFKALGDGSKLANKVKLSISKLGDLYINNSSQGVFTDGDVINKDNIKPGVVYSIVPSSQEGKYLAYPMRTNTIGLDNAKTIVEAIRLFAEPNLTEKDKESLSNITEYNFKNFSDVADFVNRIMYGSSKAEASDKTVFKLFKDNLILSKFDGGKFSLQDIVTSQETRDKIANILADRYYSVKLENLNTNKTYISYSLDDNGLIKENEYKNYQQYLNDNSVITSNIRGIPMGDNNYAFTAQPVIGIANALDIQKELTKEEKANLSVEEAQEQPSPKLTKKTMFDPSKSKPKEFDNISPEFIEEQNIKSGEDLKKKCLGL
jgi:hypothetical protein